MNYPRIDREKVKNFADLPVDLNRPDSIHVVVVNSWGPMGSALLMALIEKWGFLNLPIRKIGLPDYLLGERTLPDAFIRNSLRDCFESFGRPARRGGLSTLHWSQSQAVIDFRQIEDKLKKLERIRYDELQFLYNDYRTLFASAITYMQKVWVPGKHAELFVESARFTVDNFERSFKNTFQEVTFFHMRRDRMEWLETLASQYIFSPTRKFGFRLGQAIDEYDRYENLITNVSGTIMNLDELTSSSGEELEAKISSVLGERQGVERLEDALFDVGSATMNFSAAFKKADYKGRYFSRLSRAIMYLLSRYPVFGRWRSILFHPFYVMEMLRNRYLRHRQT